MAFGSGPFSFRGVKLDQDAMVITSGAVIEPQALNELLPEWGKNPPPVCVPVTHDEIWWLRDHERGTKLPVTPPQMHNQGNFIVSLGNVCRWLATKAEQEVATKAEQRNR